MHAKCFAWWKTKTLKTLFQLSDIVVAASSCGDAASTVMGLLKLKHKNILKWSTAIFNQAYYVERLEHRCCRWLMLLFYNKRLWKVCISQKTKITLQATRHRCKAIYHPSDDHLSQLRATLLVFYIFTKENVIIFFLSLAACYKVGKKEKKKRNQL